MSLILLDSLDENIADPLLWLVGAQEAEIDDLFWREDLLEAVAELSDGHAGFVEEVLVLLPFLDFVFAVIGLLLLKDGVLDFLEEHLEEHVGAVVLGVDGVLEALDGLDGGELV